MNAEPVLNRLRSFLLAFSGFILAGTLIELVFTNHTKEPVQWIPFGLIGLGLAALLVVRIYPQRRSFMALRWTMGLVILGSLTGMAEHVGNNIAFQLEINPNLTLFEIIKSGLGGANPLLAPGILGMAAVLAIAATYSHPLLAKDSDNRVQSFPSEKMSGLNKKLS